MMRFRPYHRLDGQANVIVDGSPAAGTVLTITHWPGYPPTESIAADLSAQMCFLAAEGDDVLPADVGLVSNNHFDQDGLVSLAALVDPAMAFPRRALLEDVAAAGDFATYRTRDAARLSMAISALADGRCADLGPLPSDYLEQTSVLYTYALARLGEWADEPRLVEELWADEDAVLSASEAAFARGRAELGEFADVDLAVVSVDPSAPVDGGHRFGGMHLDGLHPMAVNNRTERFVVATSRPIDGGWRHTVEQRYETWVQLRSRRARPRRDLVPFAGRCQEIERGSAAWSATAVGSLVPRLTSGDEPSSIDPQSFVDALRAYLAEAPPAWDPYQPVTG